MIMMMMCKKEKIDRFDCPNKDEEYRISEIKFNHSMATAYMDFLSIRLSL